jgi:hypothetical protein
MSRIMRDLVARGRKARGVVDLDVGEPDLADAVEPCGRGLPRCIGMSSSYCSLCGRGVPQEIKKQDEDKGPFWIV